MNADKFGRLLLIVFLLLVVALPSPAQKGKSKAQLQKEKQQNLEKIKEAERILNETSQQKQTSLGELSALNQRIHLQEELISSIKGEISLLDRDISEDNQMIEALQEDVKELKKEYSAMVFAAQKANNKIDQLTFIFSSTSFDQLSMRLKYMQQYSKARKDQAEAIARTQKILENQIKQTETVKTAKNTLLGDEVKENKSLSTLKIKQRSMVRSLQKEERRLRSDIDETKKAVAELDRLINEIIREEIAKAEREAREAKARAAAPKVDANAVALSASFEENKRKFAWPASGFISQKFGRQPHPDLKGIVIDNKGINIQTPQHEKVKCIFNGEVRTVVAMGVIGNSIIVNHGDYYSVYAGLKEVFVKRGDKVTSNQELGQLMVSAEGISELRFMIFKTSTPPTALDPQLWLRN
ncbi:MAG TPA: peptidoglycan DD-metalloendopeptidase family protein [Cyclobacteriaceae bacterium]|nr:peptidoglycan DD-metalloendopeptidase family protein [Cyclobacteriaceae bacterium]